MKMSLYIIMSGLMAFVILFSCKTTHPVKELSAVSNTNTAQDLQEKGKKIVGISCAPCHLDPATNTLSGAQMLDAPAFLGKIYASSLTKHPDNEITKYTDGQLRYLVRTGIKKDGKMAPFMQKPNMADEDVEAIIAFLRSDDPMVQATGKNVPPTKYTAVGRIALTSQKPLKYPETAIKGPDHNDKAAYGKYLVDIIGCYDCHSANILKVNKMNPENSKGYMAGGTKMLGADGKNVITSNLTFHETGLAGWTVQDFGKAVREGITKDNRVLRYPMRMFTDLTDSDIEAIYTYLKTLPPVNNPDKEVKSKKKD